VSRDTPAMAGLAINRRELTRVCLASIGMPLGTRLVYLHLFGVAQLPLIIWRLILTQPNARQRLSSSTTLPSSCRQRRTRSTYAETSVRPQELTSAQKSRIKPSRCHRGVADRLCCDDLLSSSVKEVVAVAQALGHKVPDSEVDVLMARCTSRASTHTLLAGRS
jgi:hypothetical protein